jgi:serine/threonine-protein kinase PpkA
MTPRRLSRLLACFAALALCASALGGQAFAQAAGRLPQLMEGKKTLFKRVIVRPGASLFATAAEQGGAPVPAFSIFYVYGQSGDLVEVGKTVGAVDGFIRADKLIDWKQTIVAVFNSANRATRERALMFKSTEGIDEVLRDPDRRGRLAALRADAAVGRSGDGPVLAIEPETPPDIRQNFYFFPILSVTSKRFGQRIDSRILQVASLSKIEQPQTPVDRKRALADMRVGVVFVVDTTTSMAPYIARVRDAIARVQGRLEQSPVGQKTRFGLIGFRQSLTGNAPGIEYHVKTFLRLGKDATAAAFMREIAKVKESPIPTADFKEDSLGGVHEALTTSEWDDFDAKFIVLVTDAGPILPESGKPLRAAGLGPAQIQRMAQEKGIEITTLHLLTPEGATDHADARAQYEALSKSGSGVSYFNVPEGAVDRFTAQLDGISDAVVARVQALAEGNTSPPVQTGNPIRDAIERNFYAMQLRYLGRREGSTAPDMFEAYLPDRDIGEPTKDVTEIRLILTKNQLATMHAVAKGIVESAERSRLDPGQFFAQLQMAIATITRDPNRQVSRQPETLGAALGEFLDGLPYASTSPILAIDSQMWVQMGAARQAEMRVDLERKLRFFEAWHNSPENWVALTRGVPDGEKVTAFPLSQLP